MKLSDIPDPFRLDLNKVIKVRIGAAEGALMGCSPSGTFGSYCTLFWILLDGKRRGHEITVKDAEIVSGYSDEEIPN